MGSLAVSTVALIVSFIVLGVNMRTRTKTRANLREAEANLAKVRESFRRLDQPVNHKHEMPAPVLTPEQWEAMYGETCREMGEEQAANRHLLDDEPTYVNGKIGGGRDRQPMIHEGEYVLRPECRGEG